jgi:hypothetical protein
MINGYKYKASTKYEINDTFSWKKKGTACVNKRSLLLVRYLNISNESPWAESIERQSFVGEVSANFCGWRVPRGQHDGSLWSYSRLSRPKLLLSFPSSSSIVLTGLSGPRSRPTTFHKICNSRESNQDLWICSQEL